MFYRRPSAATREAVQDLVTADDVATVAEALGVMTVSIDRIVNGFRVWRRELRIIEAQL